jgi:membrane associated rhomboid family serine protease
VESALVSQPLADDEAKAEAAEAIKKAATEPGLNTEAFTGAGIVFVVLLIAAFVAAQLADQQTVDKTYMKDLAGLLQTLLTAWSAAVVGLIGGEAVGAKTS